VLPFFASLRLRLILLVLLAVFPILGVLVYNASEQRQLVAADVQSEALRLARFFANSLDELDNDAHQLLIALAHVPLVRSSDSAACSAFFSDLLEEYPLYANLNAIKPDGEMFCGAVASSVPRNVAQEPYFQRVLQTRRFTIGDYQINRATGKCTVVFANPDLGPDGRVQGVTTATFDLSKLNELAAKSRLPKAATLTLVQNEGTVLYRYPETHAWVGEIWPETARFKTFLAQGSEGTFESVGTDTVGRLHAFTPLGTDSAAVYVSVAIPTALAYANVNRILIRNLATLALASMLALLAAWLGSDVLILKRVNKLVSAAKQLSNGDLSVRTGVPPGHGELGQLALAFDEMAEALQNREIEGKRSKDVLHSYAKRLEILREIDRAILEVQSPAEVAQDALQQICELAPCKVAGVVIFDFEADEAGLIVIRADGRPVPEAGSHVPLGPLQECISNLRETELIVTDGVSGGPHQWLLERISHTESLPFSIAVPLIFHGNLIGCLNLWAAAREIATPEHIEVAREVADMLAVAIQNARLFDSISTQSRELRILSARLANAQEAERRELARELHDRVGQSLTALSLNLSILGAQASAGATQQMKDRLEECQELVEDTVTCIRDVMAELRPPQLDDFGLAAALRWYAERFSRRFGLATEVHCAELLPRLPQNVETALFRVAQEALTNAARHSRGNHVTLSLEATSEEVSMVIADNGQGFDPRAFRQPSERAPGWGLLGMRERAEAMGGHLRVESGIGQGTRIIVDLSTRLCSIQDCTDLNPSS
jgi:signal transduction histidine kinase